MTHVAERPVEKTSRPPMMYQNQEDPQAVRDMTFRLARKGWPVIAVCGGALASTAWLPADNPGLGFAVLGAEVVLGVFALVHLMSSPGK
jgi:hypothetical protein